MGQTIKTQSDFNASKEPQGSGGASHSITDSIEQRIIGGSYSLIGRKMLAAMKSLKYSDTSARNKDGEEEMFKISGKRKVEEAPNLYYSGPILPKSNYYGVGYEADGMEENEFEQAKTRSNIIPMDPYDDDNKIEFDDEEVEATLNLPKKSTMKSNAFESDFKIPYKEFQSNGTLRIKGHKYELPEVPEDYDMYLVKDLHPKRNAPSHNTRMNPEKRSALLGEQKLASKELWKNALEGKKEFVKPKEEEFCDTDIVIELPFKRDSEKMKRFKAFIAEKNCQKVTANDGSNVRLGCTG